MSFTYPFRTHLNLVPSTYISRFILPDAGAISTSAAFLSYAKARIIVLSLYILLSFTECVDLSAPDNGSVDVSGGTTFKSLAVYYCEEGYYVNGSVIRECLADGNWTGLPPECILHGMVKYRFFFFHVCAVNTGYRVGWTLSTVI